VPANLGRADERAKTLGLALTLLESFPDLKAIHVAHDGYDTHANQATAHAGLLASFSDAVTAFQREVEKRDLASRVLLLAWSEFGRRPAENASAGTDHGTAGPLFLVGRGLRGGLHGEPPDLGDLSHDNLRATTDLRRVSAEVIARAWGLDPLPILGSHAPLEILS
jgi:uncharacterized protein (DUF1501 family)